MKPIKIAHLFPDLLNLYGDGGNIQCLKKRCEWRDLPVEVVEICYGDSLALERVDIVFFGGGPDREQKLATEQLFAMRDELACFIEDEGVLLAICGGYQILGKQWLMDEIPIGGLALIEVETKRNTKENKRLIGDIVIESELCKSKVVGYENHAGHTYLGKGCKPFGNVVGTVGYGNNGEDGTEGIIYKHVIGSYLHGPLLAKNPEISDTLLRWASERRVQQGEPGFSLTPLDDSIEKAAADYLLARLAVH